MHVAKMQPISLFQTQGRGQHSYNSYTVTRWGLLAQAVDHLRHAKQGAETVSSAPMAVIHAEPRRSNLTVASNPAILAMAAAMCSVDHSLPKMNSRSQASLFPLLTLLISGKEWSTEDMAADMSKTASLEVSVRRTDATLGKVST